MPKAMYISFQMLLYAAGIQGDLSEMQIFYVLLFTDFLLCGFRRKLIFHLYIRFAAENSA